jgi:hypothetical protein
MTHFPHILNRGAERRGTVATSQNGRSATPAEWVHAGLQAEVTTTVVASGLRGGWNGRTMHIIFNDMVVNVMLCGRFPLISCRHGGET